MAKAVKLGRIERFVMFCGFAIITGGVIGLYAWISSLHDDPTPVAVATPTTRPAAVVAKPVPVEPKPMALETPRPPMQAIPPAPATRPAEIVVVKPAAPEATKIEPAVQAKPLVAAVIPANVKPYAVPLISVSVVASSGDASDDQPYFYHLKIDPAEIELLRAMLTQAGKHDQLQPDEYDHLAAEPAGAPDQSWWQPGKLADVSVLAMTPRTDPRAKLWSAVSNKTGDVLVYSVKPIDFSRRAMARSGD